MAHAAESLKDDLGFMQEAVKLCNELGSYGVQVEAKALTELTNVMLAHGEDPDLAIAHAKEAVDLCQQLPYKVGEIESRKVVADAYRAFIFQTW